MDIRSLENEMGGEARKKKRGRVREKKKEGGGREREKEGRRGKIGVREIFQLSAPRERK